MANQIDSNKILNIIKNMQPTSVSSLAKMLSINRNKLMGFLEALEEQGKIQRIRVGKAIVFRVKGVD